MQTTHSLLPWRVATFGGILDANGDAVIEFGLCDPNADLIVRAVNAHADLVAALENLITACTHADPAGQEATANRVAAKRIARAALARAKGE